MNVWKIILLLQLILFGFVTKLVSCKSVIKQESPEDTDEEYDSDEENEEIAPSHQSEEEKLRLALLEENIHTGVAINISAFHYKSNETDDIFVPTPSSPGCPLPYKGNPWIYYTKTIDEKPKCYLAGFQGPCPNKMTLFAQKSSDFGNCDCNCAYGYKKPGPIHIPVAFCRISIGEEGSLGELSLQRILTFVNEWNSCYVLFEQGLCPTGQWLVFGDNVRLGPHCEPRRCPPAHYENELSFYNFKTKECHIVGEQCGPIKNNTHFVHDSNSWHPSCLAAENTHF